jgi:hypothetical protein
VNACEFQDSAHAATSNDASTGRCRAHDDLATPKAAGDLMRQCDAVQRDFNEATAGQFVPLADGIGHFVGFTECETDLASTIADHNEGAKAKVTTAFNDLATPIDIYYAFFELRLVAATISIMCHVSSPDLLEL